MLLLNFENFVGLGIMDGYVAGGGGNCGAVGVISILSCSSSYVFCLVAIFVLYSFICASKRILFIDDE